MSSYSYVAVDPQGVESRGTVDVSDQGEALRRIKEMGLLAASWWPCFCLWSPSICNWITATRTIEPRTIRAAWSQ